MRKIKFRYWDRMKGGWGDDSPFDIHTVTLEPIRSHVGGSFQNYPDCEFQQYTGLKDKNGREIYEGDILSSACNEKPCDYIVVWNDERSGEYCGFMLQAIMKDPPKVTFHIHNFKMWMAEGFEVIGNIFENRKLLKS